MANRKVEKTPSEQKASGGAAVSKREVERDDSMEVSNAGNDEPITDNSQQWDLEIEVARDVKTGVGATTHLAGAQIADDIISLQGYSPVEAALFCNNIDSHKSGDSKYRLVDKDKFRTDNKGETQSGPVQMSRRRIDIRAKEGPRHVDEPPSPSDNTTLLHAFCELYRRPEIASITRLLYKESVPIEECFINLALVEEKNHQAQEVKLIQKKVKERPLMTVSDTDLRNVTLSAAEAIHQPSQPIEFKELFSRTRQRLLIEGRAGIGKTTLCRYLLFRWQAAIQAETKDVNPSAGKQSPIEIPWLNTWSLMIWVPLRDLFQDNEDCKMATSFSHWLKLHYFKHNQKITTDMMERALNLGKVLYLFDGYDEIGDKFNDKLYEKQREWLKMLFDLPSWILTSRPNHFTKSHFYQASHLENVGFRWWDVKAYIQQFFKDYRLYDKSLSEAVSQEKANRLITLCQQNVNVRLISYVPINCELLCSVWAEQEKLLTQQGHAEDQGDSNGLSMTVIYQKVIAYLMQRFGARLGGIRPDATNLIKEYFGKLAHFLEALAWQAMQSKTLTINGKELKQLYDQLFPSVGSASTNPIDDLLASVLSSTQKETSNWQLTPFDQFMRLLLQELHVLKQVGVNHNAFEETHYYFTHLTFQEFYAAQWLVMHPNELPIKAQLAEHINDPRMHMVLIFAAGLKREDESYLKDYFSFFAEVPKGPHFSINHMIVALNALEQVSRWDEVTRFGEINQRCSALFSQRFFFDYYRTPAVEIQQLMALLRSVPLVRQRLAFMLECQREIDNKGGRQERVSKLLNAMTNDVQTLVSRLCLTENREECEILVDSLLLMMTTPAMAEEQYEEVKKFPLSHLWNNYVMSEWMPDFRRLFQGYWRLAPALMNDLQTKIRTRSYDLSPQDVIWLQVLMLQTTASVRDHQGLESYVVGMLSQPEDKLKQWGLNLLYEKQWLKAEHFLVIEQAMTGEKNNRLHPIEAARLCSTYSLWREYAVNLLRGILMSQASKLRLNDWVGSEITDARRVRVASLGEYGDPEIRGRLRSVLLESYQTEKDMWVVQTILEIILRLGDTKDDRVVPCLLWALQNSPEWGVIAIAIKVLTEIGVRNDRVIWLVKILQSACHKDARMAALGALRKTASNDERVLSAVGELLQQDKEREVRVEAVRFLSEARVNDKAVRCLLQALREDKDWKVRCEAAEALGKVGSGYEGVVQGLLQALREDEDLLVRREVVKALIAVAPKDDSVVRGLLQALQEDKDSDVRGVVAEALSAVGLRDDRVVRGLLQAFQEDKDWVVRSVAARALGNVGSGDDRVVPVLLQALREDQDRDVRCAAARALGNGGSGDDRVVPVLLQAFREEKDYGVRCAAAEALGNVGSGDDRVVPVLLQALQEGIEWGVRSAAAEALGKVGSGNEGVVLALLQALQDDKEWIVRRAAARAFGNVGSGDDRVVPVLLQALQKDKNEYVRSAAAESLGKVGSGDELVVGSLLQALQEDKDSDVRSVAARALGKVGFGDDRVVPGLLQALKQDEAWYVRAVVVEALSLVAPRDERIIVALHEVLLKDRDSDVRSAAKEALSKLKLADAQMPSAGQAAITRQPCEGATHNANGPTSKLNVIPSKPRAAIVVTPPKSGLVNETQPAPFKPPFSPSQGLSPLLSKSLFAPHSIQEGDFSHLRQLQQPPGWDGVIEYDVPSDNSCLFWSSGIAYLLPLCQSPPVFARRFKRLFGDQGEMIIDYCQRLLAQALPTETPLIYADVVLNRLIRETWRQRVIEHMAEHRDRFEAYHFQEVHRSNGESFDDYLAKMHDPDSWGGELEIQAIAERLDCRVRVFSPAYEQPRWYNDEGREEALTLVHTNLENQHGAPANHYRCRLIPPAMLARAQQDPLPFSFRQASVDDGLDSDKAEMNVMDVESDPEGSGEDQDSSFSHEFFA